MKYALAVVAAILAVVIPSMVWAQGIPSPDDMGAFTDAVVSAIANKQFGALLALGIMALTFCIRKMVAKISPKFDAFLHSDPGGVILALATSFSIALFASGGALTGPIVLGALKTAIGAMGGFAILTKLGAPLITALGNLLFKGKDGKQQAAEVVEEAAKNEAAANAEPTKPAAENLNEIK